MNTQLNAQRNPNLFVSRVLVAIVLVMFAQSTANAIQEISGPKNQSATALVNPQRIVSQFVTSGTIVTTTPDAAEFEEKAETAFHAADYRSAALAIEQAILGDPENGRMLLFAAQVFIANKDYTTAATYLDRSTQILPHEDWYFVIKNSSRFYGNDDFLRHLKQVADFGASHATALDAHLINAFFSGISGQRSATENQLQQIQNVWPVCSFAQRLTQAFINENR